MQTCSRCSRIQALKSEGHILEIAAYQAYHISAFQICLWAMSPWAWHSWFWLPTKQVDDCGPRARPTFHGMLVRSLIDGQLQIKPRHAKTSIIVKWCWYLRTYVPLWPLWPLCMLSLHDVDCHDWTLSPQHRRPPAALSTLHHLLQQPASVHLGHIFGQFCAYAMRSPSVWESKVLREWKARMPPGTRQKCSSPNQNSKCMPKALTPSLLTTFGEAPNFSNMRAVSACHCKKQSSTGCLAVSSGVGSKKTVGPLWKLELQCLLLAINLAVNDWINKEA